MQFATTTPTPSVQPAARAPPQYPRGPPTRRRARGELDSAGVGVARLGTITAAGDLRQQSVTASLPCLRQQQFEPDASWRHLTAAKGALAGHLGELIGGVCRAQQAVPENESGYQRIPGGQVHVAHLVSNIAQRRVLPQVDNQRPTTGLQNAMHLVDRGDRLAEVLECRRTDHEIE